MITLRCKHQWSLGWNSDHSQIGLSRKMKNEITILGGTILESQSLISIA